MFYCIKVLNRRMRDMHTQVHTDIRETWGVYVERQCRLNLFKPL